MGEKSKTVHVVELNGKAQHLQATLKKLQGDFNNIGKSSELSSIFTKLENSLNSILRKTSKGIIPREDFADSEKELNKVKKEVDNLYNSISSLKNLDGKKLMSFLPEDTKRKISDVEKAFNAYSATLEQVVKAEQKLEQATKKKNEAQLKATAMENSRKAYAGAATKAANELKKHQAITDALKEREDATKALKEAEEELNEAKRSGGAKQIANKQAKYDTAKTRSDSANTTVAGIDPKKIAAQEAAVRKVATANEKLAAATKDAHGASKALVSAQVAEEVATTNLANAKTKTAQEAKQEQLTFERLKEALAAANPEFQNLIIQGETTGEKMTYLKSIVFGLSEQALQNLVSSLDKAGVNFEELQIALQDTNVELGKTKEATKAADAAIGEQTAFENRIKQFLGLNGAVQLMRRALRDAIATIKELDATMTEMAVVTDLSVGDYWDQLPEYSARASELGVSINSAYKAATLYYQQGLKANEVTAISTETLKMAKIAGMDAAEATDKMTAALRGFNMELNEASARRVSDVYSELAAVTAASTQEIANAMTKTASIASSAGMEFETTAAFLSQIIETTRESAETAGTAMKTVIARFQELKKAPGDIGEVDGEIVDANAIETALRSVGVSLRDTSGQFRDLDDVFLELSKKWDSLDKNTQRYIATIAAGSRQQSRFIAMMSDYGRTQELVQKANTSAGASNKQFEKTMESLEAKLEKLKNAWHEFTMGILNSDVVKVGVDILTKFLEVINKITQGLGDNGLGGGLTKIMSILTIFKVGMKIFEKFKQPVMNLFGEIVKQAGLAGEKSAQAYQNGLQRGASSPKQAEQKTATSVGGAIATGQKTYVGEDGQTHSLTLGEKVMGKAASATGVTGFAKIGAIQQDKVAARELINTQSKEELDNNLVAAKQNVAIQQQKTEQLSGQHNLAQARKQAADTNVAQLEGKGVAKGTKEWKKATKAQKEANKALEESNNALTQQQEELKKATEEQTEAQNSVEKYEAAVDTVTNGTKKQMSAFSEGCAAASGALIGVGMGIGMVGSAFESLGMDEVAEGFNKASQIFSTTGAVLGILPPIISFITACFPGMGAASAAAGGTAAASGAAASSAWSIVGVIVLIVIAAIVVALAVILIVMAAIKNASPEKKLEEAQAAADEAAEAADRAAEAYENLANSLDELDGKYDSLEDLTRGTEEWNKAVQDINNSVLDLINQYPELAKFVENKEGVLTIDVDSAEVQSVLGDYQEKSIMASAVALGMKANVSKAKAKVAYGQLGRKARISDADAYGDAEGSFEGSRKERKEQRTEAVARALASGLMYEDNGTFVATEGSEQAIRDLGLDPDALDDFDNEVYESAEELKKYGQTLSQLDAETQAVYDAMATTALQLVDMSGWSEEEMSQAANLTDGADVKRFEEELQKKYLDDYGGDDDSSVTEDALEEFMLSQEGVSEVKKIKNNKIVYIDDEGKKQKVDKETYIKKMIATQATEKAADAAASTKFAVDQFAKDAGEALLTKGFSTEASSAAIDKLFADKSGGNLTAAELDMLGGLSEEQLKSMYGDNKDLQKLFASEKEFTDLFSGTLENGNDSLIDAREIQDQINKGQEEQLNIVQDFMKSGQAETYAKKMEEVFMRTGYAGAEAVQNALDSALAGQTDAQKQQILDTIKAYDWSDADELNNLQLQLWQTYGVGKEESWELINTIKKQNHSISSMATVVNEFGAMRQAADKLAVETQHLTELQNKYNEALKEGSDAITGVLEDMADSYRNQYKLHGESYVAAMDNLATVYAQGADKTRFGGNDMTTIVDFQTDENGNIVGLDTSNLANYGDLQSNKEVQSWLEDLQSWIDAGNDAKSGQQEVVEGLQSLQDGTNEAYSEIRNLVKESILNTMQEQIDIQRETLDATRDANDLLISKIQETITAQRTEEENEKTEQDIANMYSQMALLGMDTSGANDLQSQQMSEQIAEAEKAYEDTLIDQTLQSLSDANAQAAEQRERQIALQEEALELYQNSAEFQASIDYAMNEILTSEQPVNEALSKAIVDGQTLGMSAKEREEYLSGYAAMVYQASLASDDNFSLGDFAKSYGITGKSLESLRAASTQKAESARRSTLVSKGFTSAANSETTDVADMDTIDKILKSEDQGVITSSQDKIKRATDAGFFSGGYETEYDYYKNNQDAIMAGTKGSYTDYIKGIANDIADFENLTADQAFGGIAVPGDSWRGNKNAKLEMNWSSGAKFNSYVNGTHDDKVELGAKVENGDLIKKLNYIYNKTGDSSKPFVVLRGTASGAPDVNQGTEDKFYLRQGAGQWWKVRDQGAKTDDGSDRPENQLNSAIAYLESMTERKYTKYKTGGLADFTGPAWLDGTPSKPEYILNAEQTERFFSLVDVLKDYDSDKAQEKSGDNYFDIEINVEKLSSDYDVEQLADKIRRIIYNDATYRNVNAINRIR